MLCTCMHTIVNVVTLLYPHRTSGDYQLSLMLLTIMFIITDMHKYTTLYTQTSKQIRK